MCRNGRLMFSIGKKSARHALLELLNWRWLNRQSPFVRSSLELTSTTSNLKKIIQIFMFTLLAPDPYPACLARIWIQVVFPIPGGPAIRRSGRCSIGGCAVWDRHEFGTENQEIGTLGIGTFGEDWEMHHQTCPASFISCALADTIDDIAVWVSIGSSFLRVPATLSNSLSHLRIVLLTPSSVKRSK